MDGAVPGAVQLEIRLNLPCATQQPGKARALGTSAYFLAPSAVCCVTLISLHKLPPRQVALKQRRLQASDAAGNVSPVVTRQLSIDASCTAGEFRCAASGRCSMATLCVEGLPASLQRATAPAAEPYQPPVDIVPPDLRLRLMHGDVAAEQPQPGSSRMMQVVTTQLIAGTRFVDPGAVAQDDIDGDISASISKLGLRGLADTSSPTQDVPMMVEYRVADSTGNVALALRAVYINCRAGEYVCVPRLGTAAACSEGGVCGLSAAAEAAVQQGQVVMSLIGGAIVYITEGSTFARCTAQRPLDLICDEVRPSVSGAPFCVCMRRWSHDNGRLTTLHLYATLLVRLRSRAWASNHNRTTCLCTRVLPYCMGTRTMKPLCAGSSRN